MSFTKNDRTFPPRGRRMMIAGAINSQTVAQSVANALRSSVRGMPAPGKQVSWMTGKNPRTIRNLMDGSNAPSAATLIELMREFDEVYHAVLDLAQRQPQAHSGADIHQRIEQAMSILSGEDNGKINHSGISSMGRIQTDQGL